eukprot:5080062-Prymnesium_polylepis.1
MDIGGISCRGCMWGVDHAPFETLFSHHFVSPAFEYGAAKVYSDMDLALHHNHSSPGVPWWSSRSSPDRRSSSATFAGGTVEVVPGAPVGLSSRHQPSARGAGPGAQSRLPELAAHVRGHIAMGRCAKGYGCYGARHWVYGFTSRRRVFAPIASAP